MSRLNVDKITGATGTASGAPITLSGDTATLGSGVTDSATSSTSVTNDSTQYLDLNDCFSASYSVYDFYLSSVIPAVTTGVDLYMWFLTSDGNVSSADMWLVLHDQYYSSSNQNNTDIVESTNGNLVPLHDADSDMGRGAFVKGTIFNPFSSVDNTSGHLQSGFRTEISGQTSKWAMRDMKFSQETLVSCTGLRFNWASGNWATGATNPVGKLIVKGVR